MGVELSDDGWNHQPRTRTASVKTENVRREPILPRSRFPSRPGTDDKTSTNSHHTPRSFFGGIHQENADSSSEDEVGNADAAEVYSYRSSQSAHSKTRAPTVVPESSALPGTQPKESLPVANSNQMEKDLIEFSRSSHSNLKCGSNSSKYSIYSHNVDVTVPNAFPPSPERYLDVESSIQPNDQTMPTSTRPINESERNNQSEIGIYPRNRYLPSTRFKNESQQMRYPKGEVENDNGWTHVSTNTPFGLNSSFAATPSHQTIRSRRNSEPENRRYGIDSDLNPIVYGASTSPNQTRTIPVTPVRDVQEEPAGFGTIFGRDFCLAQPKPRQTAAPLRSEGEKPLGFGTINAGFGNKGAPKSAGYIKSMKEDAPRTASTFVPPEIKAEVLFKNRIKPGTRFEEFFHTNVDITRCGMKNTTRIDRITSFDAIHLTQEIRNNVKLCEYESPTPVQQHTMPLISEGLDVLACAQTGCGKTAAFLLPIISKLLETRDIATTAELVCSPRCLVIAPTRELAVQIHEEGKKFAFSALPCSGIQVKAIYGGTSVDYQRRDIKGASILVATVGRLVHFLQDGCVNLEKIKFLVLDEADRMLDLGFGKEIEKILEMKTLPQPSMRQTLMFSATFPTEVQMIAQKLLRTDYVMVTVDKVGIASRCVQQEFFQVEQHAKIELVLKLLDVDLNNYSANLKSGIFLLKTIIFVSTKSFADTLGAFLCEANIPSTTIHGDRQQAQRAEAMRDFVAGRKAVLIATGVAERGLDIRGVDHVINYDLPQDIESYIHRIGRTGRVGNPGRATSFFTNSDIPLAPHLVRVLKDVGQPIPPFLESYGGGTPVVKLAPSSMDVNVEQW